MSDETESESLLKSRDNHTNYLGVTNSSTSEDVTSGFQSVAESDDGSKSNQSKDRDLNVDDSAEGKKDKKGEKIDFVGSERLRLEIHKNLKQHLLATEFYKRRDFLFFQLPLGLLSLISAVLAFLGGSSINEKTRQIASISAGIISSITIFIQTMRTNVHYDEMYVMHRGTAVDLRDLHDQITLLQALLRKNEEMIREGKKPKPVRVTFEEYESQYQHALSGCKSVAPAKITEAFLMISSSIDISKTKGNRKVLNDMGIENYMGITYHAYNRLACVIIEYKGFPVFLPDPMEVAEEAIRQTRSDLQSLKDCWAHSHHRDNGTSIFGSLFSSSRGRCDTDQVDDDVGV